MHTHEPLAEKRELRLYNTAFLLSVLTAVIEFAASFVWGSVALFSDAAHIVSDGSTYGLLALVVLASRFYPSREMSLNKLSVWIAWAFLLVADIMIFREAISRIISPHDILAGWTLFTAVLGLVLNAIIVRMMHKTPKDEHNIRHSAMWSHAISDLLVSAGVIFSAGIVLITGIQAADWIVALVVAGYLFVGPFLALTKQIMQGEWELSHEHHHDDEHED